MSKFAQVGDFCPNKACADYGKRQGEQQHNIIRMERARRYTGEGLVFGIEEGQVEEFLRVRGYTQIQNVTSADLARKYFTGVNQTRTIAPIYAIVHATARE
jgi:O-methyltransferase involved in polyketide biosynthesis